MKKGKLYGIGVGPGDPELITVAAARILQDVDIVAAPQTNASIAWKIAEPYIAGKPTMSLAIPMVKDVRILNEAYQKAAEDLIQALREEKNVAFLTLGDVSLYSTFTNIHRLVTAQGYQTEWIPGIPAMCATAAALQEPLAERREPILVLPAVDAESIQTIIQCLKKGSHVLAMKFGMRFLMLKEQLEKHGFIEQAAMVVRCGMEEEKVIRDIRSCDEAQSYFSTMLIKAHRGEENG